MSATHLRAVPEPEPSLGFNPFPGLRPFEPDEDYLFFGRETQTDELLRKLRTTRFLSILGSSGSGKSSLVRSGLIPTLYGGGMTRAGSRWRVAIMRPGEDPLGNLAAALSVAGALGEEDGDEGLTRAFYETTLRASQLGLVECIRQSRIPPRDNVLVLVDQFEELFRYKRSRRVVGRDEAVAFVKLLLAARTSDLPVYIAVTMRSDFIGDCMEFGQLPEVINDGIYLVPRMTRDELKSAITGPVAVGGALIAPRLVSRLLNDVGDDPDQLPILQHALMRTWDNWERDQSPGEGLDLRHYEAIGTMHTALSRHAEESYGELDERGQEIAEKLFKALTDKGSDMRGVRRPAPLGEIAALAEASVDEVIEVVERFRKPGRSFLMPPVGIPLRETSILDISHESLMRVWDRLSGWAIDEARSGQLYLNVARAAQRHEDGIAALWRDPELQLALTWRAVERPTEQWASRYDPFFARAMQFLDDSRTERDQEVRDRDARRRRELRLARSLVVIFSTFSLLMLALGAYAWNQKGKADRSKNDAVKAKDDAVKAEREAQGQRNRALRLQRDAETARDQAKSEKARAEREEAEAKRQAGIAERESLNAQTQQQLAVKEKQNADEQARLARAESIRADEQRKNAEAQKKQADDARADAEQSQQKTARFSHRAGARAVALTIPQKKGDPDRTALLALAAYEVNQENDGPEEDPDIFNAMRVALAGVADQARNILVGPNQSIRSVAIAPDGVAAFVGSDDGKLLRYDLKQRGEPTVIASLGSPVRSVAMRAPGFVAAGTAGGQVRLWDTRNASAAPRELANGTATVSALAFQPAGSLLAAASHDGTVKLMNVDRDVPAVTLTAATGKRATAVAFSPDGKTVAAGLSDKGGALLWDVAHPDAAPRKACAGVDVRSVAFRPNGKELVCGDARGDVLRDPLSGNGSSTHLAGHASSVNSLSFDRSGRFLVSASSDSKVYLWDLGDSVQPQPIVLQGHDSWVWSVAFSPKGDRLISGGQDGTLRVWPARTDVLAADLCRAVSSRKKQSLTKEEWAKDMPKDVQYKGGAPCQAGR